MFLSHIDVSLPLFLHPFPSLYKLNKILALASMTQWTECQPVDQKVAGLVFGQGTCLDCGPGPQLGGV